MAQHLALYRKWRPLTFDDVFGQEHVTNALRTQVDTGRTSHAYLFTGTRGTGKTTCAKILAKAVNCLNPDNGNPCNVCAACRSILEESALDVSEIDAASNNGVDNIRDIREEAGFAPTTLSKRVYIIDEVHMLSPGAFNALLKTLEEPPEHVLFILATTEIHKVPATILSRCQRYDFRRIPPEIIAARLRQIASSEGFELEAGAAALLARLGDGSMRDAISLLDRAVSGDGKVDLKRVTEALGVPPAETAASLYEAVAAGDGAKALALFTGCYLEGEDIVSLFDQLLSLMRDLYVLRATGREEYLSSAGALPIDRLRALAGSADGALLDYFVRCVSDLLTRLTRTAIKRTDGEMCLLKMCLRHGLAGESPAAQPVQALPVKSPAAPARPAAPAVKSAPAESAAQPPLPGDGDAPPWDDAPAVPAPKPAAPPPRREEAPTRTAAPQAGGGDESVRSAFLAVAGPRVSGAVRTYLGLSRMEVRDGTLHIGCLPESMIFMNKPAVQEVLAQAARECGYERLALGKLGEASAPVAAPAPKPTAEEGPKSGSSALDAILQNARRLGVEIKE